MQRGALALWHPAWQHIAVPDMCHIHADNAELYRPCPCDGLNLIVLPQKVHNVLPIMRQVEVVARRDSRCSVLVALLQATPNIRNVADDSGQFLAQRIDETIAPIARRSAQPEDFIIEANLHCTTCVPK